MLYNLQEFTKDFASDRADQTLKEPRTLLAVGAAGPNEPYLNYLRNIGYIIGHHPSVKGLYNSILAHIPNVLLLDVDALGEEAIVATQTLKENPLTYTMPIIIVIGEQDLSREIAALEAGAEDYLAKPFSPQVLAARIHTSIRRNIRLQVSNPLTGLPGAIYIEQQAGKRLDQNLPIAMCYADLDHFKAFNDKYGYSRGDNVIRILATILNEGVSLYGQPGDFVGHIGGDDFIMVIDYHRLREVCDYVVSCFDTLVPFQYDQEDMESEFIISKNRIGEETRYPLMTVSIGIVTNQVRRIDNYLTLVELAAEMKEYAKSISKSSPVRQSIYRIDQRGH